MLWPYMYVCSSFQIDPTIMGGMTVNFGDKFIDMSTATKVNKFTAVLQGNV